MENKTNFAETSYRGLLVYSRELPSLPKPRLRRTKKRLAIKFFIISKNEASTKKHLSTRNGAKLRIENYFKRNLFITQKFLVLSLKPVWRFLPVPIQLCSGLFLLVPARSGLCCFVLAFSGLFWLVVGRYFFYKRGQPWWKFEVNQMGGSKFIGWTVNYT